jgi:hypothetical protein
MVRRLGSARKLFVTAVALVVIAGVSVLGLQSNTPARPAAHGANLLPEIAFHSPPYEGSIKFSKGGS